MNTVLRPVGPQPARVYWVRRLVLLGVLLAVAFLVGSLLARDTGGDAAAAQEADDGGRTSAEAAGADAAEDGAGDGADAAGEPESADGAPVPCAPEAMTVTLAADATSYAAGQTPTFTITFTNTGGEACVIDAGAANQALVVTSGSDRIWSSADCPADGGTRTLLLAPGAQDQDVVAWPRVRSDETCTDGLPEPRPGTYTAVAVLGGAQSGSTVFDLG